MLNQRVLSTACVKPVVKTQVAAPLIRDVVDLRALLDVLRRVKGLRAVASADVKEFSRRIDVEIPRYRLLAERFEGSSDPGYRRRLQSSLHHLHNLRFAVRNAASAVGQADRVIANIQGRIDDLRAPATWRAA